MNRTFHLIFPTLLCVIFQVLSPIPARGQMYDVLEQVAASRDKAAGVEGPYRFDAAPLTDAPKGYKPFYISHYGRHGSRYAWSSNTYSKIKEILEAAHKADALTPRGQRLYDDYMDFYLIPSVNLGDLSEMGGMQHHQIAKTMCEQFPEVFKDGGLVSARASVVQRAIVSMNAFTLGLQKYAPKVDITVSALHTDMLVVNPYGAAKEIAKRYEGELTIPESTDSFRDRMTDYEGIFGNLFTDMGFLEEIGGRRAFVYELFNLWAGYHNYVEGDWLEDIFTKEQVLAQWEIENYTHYIGHTMRRYHQIPLLEDIIHGADLAIDGGSFKGHFRFGHDTVFNALITLLNLNGVGFQPTKAEDVKYWFQNFNTPMAANLQFVFYRSKKDPDILFKVLWNGQESTFPQLTPVSGPYYRWTDFKAWAEEVVKEHPMVVQ